MPEERHALPPGSWRIIRRPNAPNQRRGRGSPGSGQVGGAARRRTPTGSTHQRGAYARNGACGRGRLRRRGRGPARAAAGSAGAATGAARVPRRTAGDRRRRRRQADVGSGASPQNRPPRAGRCVGVGGGNSIRKRSMTEHLLTSALSWMHGGSHPVSSRTWTSEAPALANACGAAAAATGSLEHAGDEGQPVAAAASVWGHSHAAALPLLPCGWSRCAARRPPPPPPPPVVLPAALLHSRPCSKFTTAVKNRSKNKHPAAAERTETPQPCRGARANAPMSRSSDQLDPGFAAASNAHTVVRLVMSCRRSA